MRRRTVRRCFEHLTVEENLMTGAYTRRDSKAAIRTDLDLVYSYFPNLMERRSLQSGYISGGEQQMLAIGRALMSKPRLMLLDEPSMGLAPQLVEQIFETVRRLNENEGVTILLAEQNTNIALRFATHGYVLESGRIVLDGAAEASPADVIVARGDLLECADERRRGDEDRSGPAGDRAPRCRETAGVRDAGRHLQERSDRWRRLAQRIVAPARHAHVAHHTPGVVRAGRQLAEGTGGRRRLA